MLEQKIHQDYLLALKAKDREVVDFLSFVRAEIKDLAIQLKKDKLEDNEVLGVLKKIKKRLVEVRQSLGENIREDFLKKTDKELSILNQYLPVDLSEKEILDIIEDIVSKIPSPSLKEMGRVMREVLNRIGPQAEARLVSELVKKRLSVN